MNISRSRIPAVEEGRSVIRAFCEECVWAWAIRKHFAELFESGATRHQLLAQTARTFFQDLNVVMMEYVMPQQSKLTDAAEMPGHANLTTEHLLEFEWPGAVRKQLAWQNITLQQFRKKIAAARSKLVAHSDLRSRLSGAPLGSFTEKEESEFWTALEQLRKYGA